MTDTARDAALAEAALRTFQVPWAFRTEVRHLEDLPAIEGVEIAFAGRSNVGKSSLINALTFQKSLARTSNTPGRTQGLVLFTGAPGLTMIDMPGYGYAEAPKHTVDTWTKLILDYLRGRPTLRRVFLLIDSRHGLKKTDVQVMDLLDKSAVGYQIVLTKADKPKGVDLDKTEAAVAKAIAKRPAAHPVIIRTSSIAGSGLETLRTEIYTLTLGPGEWPTASDELR
ncbi:MAG: ribosome biogenesis GTP-binding protein YihA/YsxC [Hyphomicrobiales bacterium]